MSTSDIRMVHANGLDFGVLEAGSGPLALCLHGFPDCAYTWRHLLPALAGAGFHAVAPFTRGYAPTSVAADARYDVGARADDAIALHEALGGDERAVLIGHDWGAETAYVAGALAPGRWRRLVALAVPPRDVPLLGDPDQRRRFDYFFLLQSPLAEARVAHDEMAFIDDLWRDWSPGYDASEDLPGVKACLAQPQNLGAAIGYYRAYAQAPDVAGAGPQPTLYLHGANDGCIGAGLVGSATAGLALGSRTEILEGVGHFLHLEAPDVVNAAIVEWVAGS
jgi:pimeloyl-ACP methyl ester carboxylesterase